MNKTEFTKKFSQIVNKYPARTGLSPSDSRFVLDACSKCLTYAKLAQGSSTQVRAGWHILANGRKVKMLFLHKNGGDFGVPISKTRVINSLYPPKTRKIPSPEKNHRNKVLSAMRLAVEPQLKEYRASVEYPLDCWRSGLCIRKGMKTDVDHIGTPFLKIAEDWLESRGIKYADVILAGAANAKYLKDAEMELDWYNYHKEKATLALVLAKYNRAAGAGDYSSREDLLGSFSDDGGIGLGF